MEPKNIITEDKIFELYGDYLLNHGERPKNIYRFAKDNEFEEKDFYDYFSSFEQIEKSMLVNLFDKSVELASEINNSDEITSKEKLLNVYFIFFENMTMNRSLVLMILGNDKLHLAKISNQLKETHRQFVKTLDFNDWEMIQKAKDDLKKFHEKAREEALWIHLVSAIEFWKKDTSPSFEKTDIFIEKTIDTGFELMENEPLRKIVDLGKFLFKEKFKK
ncbi:MULTISPECIES: TetR/AcrR family transcriptional regulator [Chryseobacterium]|uniref:TetR/AcrR family transcriptional regulator n=1 Tax=Chryseobacterium cucumeris TaxID=1813611 RepID=A0ABX9WZL4_9FLAO|nr:MULTISPECIES: TetR/AcrR family transcriptional regulator [Chryseobacterium]MDH5032652.1 TetR/AcrR family transcriptional regulator [Chryseobacterium cucumeris]ROH86081.1 TetR/AcrR family transcriptional regulator [Chryseobacterium cucumeris]WNI38144.1 TetR/AcrR family transcriptional regulator [Chryseobacterium sp. SG20098]